jgi:hypothetical protein
MIKTTEFRRYNHETKEYYSEFTAEKVYTMDEINSFEFQSIIDTARQLWRKRCNEYVAANPKPSYGGCCYMSTVGIRVLVIKPRYRIPVYVNVLSPQFGYQGEHVWTGSADEIVEFIKSHGIECYFSSGSLD